MYIISIPPQKRIKFLSIGLFLTSLACPCYDTGKEVGGFGQGAGLLISGILWFMFASPGFVWLANPLLLFSWINADKKPVKSFILSLTAIVIALCFLLYKDIIIDESGSNTTPIIAHRFGYQLWLASMLTILINNFYLKIISNKSG